MGTISGSGVANVVTIGQFTIPLMKRFGYTPAFAGGVEATASMGGQIMPPVMGAVAFIMAETLDVPYAEIVKAAIIPAILYFGRRFWMVHLEAGSAACSRPAAVRAARARSALVRQHWHLVLPLAALVYLLFAGYTPLFAGTVGLALTVVLILGAPLAARLGAPARSASSSGSALGLAAASFLWLRRRRLLGLVVALSSRPALVRGGRDDAASLPRCLADGARQALPVGIACAIVGIVIGTLTLTGIGHDLRRLHRRDRAETACSSRSS